MKRIVFVSILILLVFSVVGYIGYQGPEDQPHAMDSSVEEVQSPDINGESWNLSFSEAETLNKTEFAKYSFEGLKVSLEGVVKNPTPCYKLNPKVSEIDNNYYSLNITSKRIQGKQLCPQVITYKGYNTTFTAKQPFKLDLVYNGQVVKEIEHSNYPPTKGFVEKLLGFFNNLF